MTKHDVKLAGGDLALTFFASCMNTADDILIFSYEQESGVQIIRFEYDFDYYEVVFESDDAWYTITQVSDYVASRNEIRTIYVAESVDSPETIYEQIMNKIVSR